MRFQPTRPKRNARAYSTAWIPASGWRGARGATTRPPRTPDPLATRIVPPAASTSSRSRNGRIIRSSASGSMSVSASMAQTSSPDATLRPALSASALRPFSLSTTTRLGFRRER